MNETDITEAGRAALAKLAALDALCEQQTRTIALTSEKVAALEKARDEVGIQLAAAQARLRLAMAVVEEGNRCDDICTLSDEYGRRRAALDAVPGDALATCKPDLQVGAPFDEPTNGVVEKEGGE
jgi:hypothetical protein